jgi:hypothetical protein
MMQDLPDRPTKRRGTGNNTAADEAMAALLSKKVKSVDLG